MFECVKCGYCSSYCIEFIKNADKNEMLCKECWEKEAKQ